LELEGDVACVLAEESEDGGLLVCAGVLAGTWGADDSCWGGGGTLPTSAELLASTSAVKLSLSTDRVDRAVLGSALASDVLAATSNVTLTTASPLR